MPRPVRKKNQKQGTFVFSPFFLTLTINSNSKFLLKGKLPLSDDGSKLRYQCGRCKSSFETISMLKTHEATHKPPSTTTETSQTPKEETLS